MKTNEELKTIALDLYKGKIFCDRSLPQDEFDMIKHIFLPINFMEKCPEDIGMIYEYFSEAGPLSTNGYPSFMSFKILTKEEANIVIDFYKEIKDKIERI